MAFQAFFLESTKHYPFHSLQQYLHLTQDDFDTFRLSPSYYAPLLGYKPPSSFSFVSSNVSFINHAVTSNDTSLSAVSTTSLTVAKSNDNLLRIGHIKSQVVAKSSDTKPQAVVKHNDTKVLAAPKSNDTELGTELMKSAVVCDVSASLVLHLSTTPSSYPYSQPAFDYRPSSSLCTQLPPHLFSTTTAMYLKYHPPSLSMCFDCPLVLILRFGVNCLPSIAFFVILLHFKGGLSSLLISSLLSILLVHADGEAYWKGNCSAEWFRHFECLVKSVFNEFYEWGVRWSVSSRFFSCGFLMGSDKALS